MCELLELVGPTAKNMMVAVVRNKLTGELTHFGWERNSRCFVRCNDLGEVEHAATRYVNPRELINDVWPSEHVNSAMSLTVCMGSFIEKIGGMQ